ncbi:uncharacterized protein F44E2.8-like, partial [Saccostrea cucullata]|uniref:uncharacterized protein F44E2.8-like n=1 Tax=Saccostrea cuccullata TaxID=36930 RepID=UPI002ED5323F
MAKLNQSCRVCKQTGHKPGSKDCEHYSEPADGLVVFQGKENPLSNFFPCDVKVFGETHKSAEHAYQLTKAIRSGDFNATENIRVAPTALEAKRIGDKVKIPEKWQDQKETVMEEIIHAKATQVPELREKLENSDAKTLFAEATNDIFWGTGLYPDATLHTNPEKMAGRKPARTDSG